MCRFNSYQEHYRDVSQWSDGLFWEQVAAGSNPAIPTRPSTGGGSGGRPRPISVLLAGFSVGDAYANDSCPVYQIFGFMILNFGLLKPGIQSQKS